MLARTCHAFSSITFELLIFRHGMFPFCFSIDAFISFHMRAESCARVRLFTIWAFNFGSSAGIFTISAAVFISGYIALIFLKVLDGLTLITGDASFTRHDLFLILHYMILFLSQL